MVNVEGFPHVFGGSLPARIWHDFMIKALAGMRVMDFPPPSFIGFDQQPKRVLPLPPPPAPAPSPSPSPSCTPRPNGKPCKP